MINVSLFDSSFAHTYSRGNGDLKILPKHVNFDRRDLHKTIFYTDGYIVSNKVTSYSTHNNIAWAIESKSLDNQIYKSVIKNCHSYDYILTHDLTTLKELQNENYNSALWCPAAGCWIEYCDRSVYSKTKNLSIIASEKRNTYGHKLRHDIIEKSRTLFDGIYGRAYQPVKNKITALKDYRFSVTIENENSEDAFTEKLIDCFVTGTIPIYYGTPNIGKYFNIDSILTINNIDDFDKITHYICEDYYQSKITAIYDNFERAKNYVNSEDWIYNNYPQIFKI